MSAFSYRNGPSHEIATDRRVCRFSLRVLTIKMKKTRVIWQNQETRRRKTRTLLNRFPALPRPECYLFAKPRAERGSTRRNGGEYALSISNISVAGKVESSSRVSRIQISQVRCETRLMRKYNVARPATSDVCRAHAF